jgi:hypothetical protein
MKYSKMIKWAAAIGCVCSAGFVSQTSAISLTFDLDTYLGQLDRVGGGKDKEEKYINQLARMTPNTTSRVNGRTYTRSGNSFDSLPAADFEFRENHGHTGIILDGSYDYLLASYGSATVVWYVGALTGSYDLPSTYNGNGTISHYSLFQSDGLDLSKPKRNPSKVVKVPDSGSTFGLLGLGIASLGLLKRQGKWRHHSSAARIGAVTMDSNTITIPAP